MGDPFLEGYALDDVVGKRTGGGALTEKYTFKLIARLVGCQYVA